MKAYKSPLEHPSAVTAIALSRDGQRLFTATVTGAVRPVGDSER